MDKKQIGKYIMMFLGAVLTLGANLVNTKNQDDRMKETVAEKVKEATLPTNLVYSEYFSNQTGNKVYLKPENMQYT